MNDVMTALYFNVISAAANVKGFLTNEFNRVKNDERGMELVQIIIIILIVVVIAAVLWGFLSGFLGDILDNILYQAPEPTPFR